MHADKQNIYIDGLGSSGVCAVLRGAASVLRGSALVLRGSALVLRGVRLSAGVEREIGMKPCVNELCYEVATFAEI